MINMLLSEEKDVQADSQAEAIIIVLKQLTQIRNNMSISASRLIGSKIRWSKQRSEQVNIIFLSDS